MSSAPRAVPLVAELVAETYVGGSTEWRFRLAGGQHFIDLATDNARPEGAATAHLLPDGAVILEQD